VPSKKQYEAYNGLLKVNEILESHSFLGEYDLIAKVETSDAATLTRLVVEKVRTIPGVLETHKLTSIRF
jgi:DNA-binding Lrp family transcriptional regulator